MKKFTFTFFVLAGAFMMFLSSCEYDYINPGQSVIPIDTGGNVTPTKLSVDVQPIFTSDCAKSGCHVTGGTAPDLTAGKTFNALTSGGFLNSTNPSQGILYKAIAAGGSMSSFIDATDRLTIQTWLVQGAKNN